MNTGTSGAALLPLQLIVAVLAMGPVLFLIVLLTFDFGPRADAPLFGGFMTYTAVGVAAVAGLANIALSIVLIKVAHRRPHTALGLFSCRTIGGAFIFAFATFFAAAAMMLEQSVAALILAVCLVLAIGSRFPTRGIAARWTGSELD